MRRDHRTLLTGGLLALVVLGSAEAGAPDDDLAKYVKKGPRPPERVGEQVKIPFPPPTGNTVRPTATRPDVKPTAPAVVLHQPEGVEQTPRAVSVTFNQPMVPVSSVGVVQQAAAPLRIDPPLTGELRWQGTTTLSMQPKGKVPQATRYEVTVPAGTRSAAGVAMKEAFRFTFDTPLPAVTSTQPYDRATEIGLDAPIVLTFNQAVSGERIARHVGLRAKGGKAVALRAVPREEWARDERFRGYGQGGGASAVAIFVPVSRLAPDTTYEIEVRAGLVGDEGPLPMARPFQASFSTYPPMAVARMSCGECSGWGTDVVRECPVGSGLCVGFNHPIKIDSPERFVSLSPRPKDLKLRVAHNGILIEGQLEAERSYLVEVKAGVADSYGQKLREPWSARVAYQHLPPELEVLLAEASLVERGGKLEVPVRVRNVDSLGIEAFRLGEREVRAGLSVIGHSRDSSSFDEAMKPLRPSRVEAWTERLALPRDKAELRQVPLRRLVQQHGPGPYLLLVERERRPLLVQLTDIGLTARYDSEKMVVLATSIASGAPLPGVRLALADDEGKALEGATTGGDGLAVLRASPRSDRGPSQLLLHATLGKDRAFLRLSSYGDDGRSVSLNWGHPERRPYERTFLYPDRDLYRPGEEVHVFGIHRRYDGSLIDRIGPPGPIVPVTWSARSSRNRELGKGSVEQSGLGAFHVAFKLPDEVDLGQVYVQTSLGSLGVQVQEYRAPEFEVGVRLARSALVVGDTLEATVRGDYLFGAPMRGAEVRWNLLAEESRSSPPGHAEFHFGSAIDPWRDHERHPRFWREGPSSILSGSGKLDDKGRLALSLPLTSLPSQLDPSSLILEAQVSDLSRQVVAGRAALVAHPADRHLGVRLGQAVVEAGASASVEVVLVDHDGGRVAGVPITVKATSVASQLSPGVDEEGNAGTVASPETIETRPCTVTSGKTALACSLTFPRGGRYLLDASSVDSKGRRVATQTWVMVLGKDTVARDTRGQRIELLPDRKVYRPGQTASITVRAPFAEGVVLVTEERRGLLGHQLLRVVGHVATAKVAIREDHIPNLEVSATAVLARGKDRPPAAWALGTVSLEIARDAKRLEVKVVPARETARPGEKLPVDVWVTDAQGKPVAATVSLVAVDEAVLSMSGFATPDPLPVFHYNREAGVTLGELLKLLLPEKAAPERMAKRAAAPSMAAEEKSAESEAGAPGGGRGGGAAAATRRLFLTTPTATVTTTGRDGRTQLVLPLPDNLTRFRLMAVAADASDHFGRGEAVVRVQRALQLRPALPRFANTSDAFVAAVVVDNQTARDGRAEVTITAEGIDVLDAPSTTLDVPAGGAREATFRVQAPRPGPARVRFAVRLGQESDAVESSFPVWVPATSEAFATYGTTTTSAAQPIAAPRDVLPGYGGLSIQLASTALTGLQDASRYLTEYPYGCAEQVSSKAMPMVVLGDIVEKFGIGGPALLALQRKHAEAAVGKLVAGQRGDGAWGSWSASDEGRADLTAYIMIVLRRAREAGIDVPQETAQRASAYLTRWLRARGTLDARAPRWQRRHRLDSEAMALYALGDWGQGLPDIARGLHPEAAEMDLFARAMLAAVFHRLDPRSPEAAALLRELHNRVVQTPASARFVEQESEALRLLMHSSSRTDAIVLLVLLEVEPASEIVPKVVRGLMDARVNGRWETTQANAFALYALSRYFRTHEAEPTDFTASMWLGEGFLGKTTFAGRTMREETLTLPMNVVQAARASDVTLGKTGSGRLYYRIGLSYAPRSFALPALDQGFTVQRSYEAVGAADEVQRDKDGRWQVRVGSYVRVHLKVVVQDRRYYVVVDDPLPAGLELVNTALQTSARGSLGGDGDPGWLGYWTSWRFNHRELRDERSLHFADDLEPGVYDLTVIARATARGTFLVPPTRAEEMYRPEVFGRTATDHLTVR